MRAGCRDLGATELQKQVTARECLSLAIIARFPTFICTILGCFEEETWYMGRRMFALSNVSDAELCQQLCFGHSGCHFFSYQVDQGVCHFKEGVRYPKTAQRSSMVSGPSNCPPPRLCEPGWLGYREVNLCYHVAFFVEELHTAAEASAWCDFEPDSHPDSKIAEPRTREQQDAVANFYRVNLAHK